HLDGALGALPPNEQAVAANVFRYLVTPSGTKIALGAKDLSELTELPETEVASVLGNLSGGSRILRPVAPPLPSPQRRGARVARGEVAPPRYEIFHDVLASAVLDWRRRYEADQDKERIRREEVEKQEQLRREALARTQRLRTLLAGAVVF